MSEPSSQSSQPVDPDLAVGQPVGEYVVQGRLGEGAFGTVYRAVQPLIGKQVAIKVLARKFSVDPDMVSRFVAEARTVNQIRHRHIIDIFSFGQLTDGRHYYVMEYLDGEPLDALLARRGRLPLAEALPILRGIARALDAAHAKGVAHRDLKAENVFLAIERDADGERYWPKLLDFGIAKLLAPEDGLTHKTRTGTPVGTPYYMSPEQCRGRDVDHRTDLYAFGVLAYLMLTGQYPHDADDYMSILMRQITEEPVPPSGIAPELPAGIDEVIAWLMRKQPIDRPPDLRSAVDALTVAAEQAGIAVAACDVHSGPVARVDTRPPNVAAARPTGVASQPPASKPVSNAWANAETVVPGATPSVASAPTPRRRSRAGLAIAGAIAGLGAVAAVVIVRPWDRPGAPRVVQPPQTDAPPPVPQPAPPAVPQPAPPPVPIDQQTVMVTITGAPEGTEVLVGGMTAGAAPGPVQLPRDTTQLVLTFKMDGYLPTSRTIVPDRDQAVAVTLKKKPAGPRPKRSPSKDDIIDILEHER